MYQGQHCKGIFHGVGCFHMGLPNTVGGEGKAVKACNNKKDRNCLPPSYDLWKKE